MTVIARRIRRGILSSLALAGAAALLWASPALADEARDPVPAPVVDHHIHIQSALVTDMLRSIQKTAPESFDGISDDLFTQRSGADAVRELDRAGIRQGVLLSTGYMFGFPGVPLDPAERARRMRAENRFNVDAARASKGRLIAFVGISPFAPGALEELDYWSRQPGAAGIKLHLGNSGFDPARADQVTQLATFFAAASKARMPIIVHIRGAAPYTAAGVVNFIDKVLSQAGDLPVQIAHGGGYGGVDQATLDALAAFGEAIARKAPGTANLVFDISAVVQGDFAMAAANKEGTSPEKQAENKRATEAHHAAYVALMRKIGLDRFVLASDWPGLKPPAEYFAAERTALPVTAAEWAELCGNRAPYFRREWAATPRVSQ